MTDLVEFLRARLDEDEAAARRCAEVYPEPWEVSDRGYMANVRSGAPEFRLVTSLGELGTPGWVSDHLVHIARHDPARVLREVEAKRELVDYEPEDWDSPDVHAWHHMALCAFAAAYADHPDYQQEWAQ